MQDDAARSGSLTETVKSVWGRRKWLGVAVFTVPFVAAVSLIVFMPGVYRSTATVLVDRQQVPESMVKPTVTSALETRLHTISQEILSRSRLDALIKQFDLYSDLRHRVPPEAVIERMRKDIKLELKSVEQKDDRRAGATIAFALSYDGREPQMVARVTNTLASFFIEENLRVRERQAAGTAEFLKVQLAEVKKRLDDQEAIVSAFKKRYMGELPQQTDANLSAIERLSTQLRLNSDSQTRVAERRESILRQLNDAAAMNPGTAGPEGVAERLARLTQELRALRTTYSDKYPDIARIKQEIATLEAEAASAETKTDKKPTFTMSTQVLRLKNTQSELESELNILKGEDKRLRSALASYIGRVENSPKREQEFRELSRDYESTRENYGSLMKRYEDAQLAESMEQRQKGEQFRLLDPAIPGSEPTAPNRLRLLFMALAGCLALALGVVVATEHINASFHSVDDLRTTTTVPVLLSIPLIVTPEDMTRDKQRFRVAAASVAIALVVIIGASFFIAHGNEQLVALVTKGRM